MTDTLIKPDEPPEETCPRCGAVLLVGQFRTRRGEIVTHWCPECNLGGNL